MLLRTPARHSAARRNNVDLQKVSAVFRKLGVDCVFLLRSFGFCMRKTSLFPDSPFITKGEDK